MSAVQQHVASSRCCRPSESVGEGAGHQLMSRDVRVMIFEQPLEALLIGTQRDEDLLQIDQPRARLLCGSANRLVGPAVGDASGGVGEEYQPDASLLRLYRERPQILPERTHPARLVRLGPLPASDLLT